MTISTLVVDDEPAARRGIVRRLQEEADIEVVGECGDGASAIAAISELAPKLVLLDVQMPELGGFDVIDAIGLERMPATIFVTAYDQYAVRAFDVHALDYILKPIDGARFTLALQRARTHLGATERSTENLRALLAGLGREPPRRWAKRLAIKSPGRVTLIDVADVGRFESAGNYIEVHVGSRAHLLRETMASLEARLDPECYVRISRSAIVNVALVRELQPLFNGDFVVILKDGSHIAGSRRYREALSALLGE